MLSILLSPFFTLGVLVTLSVWFVYLTFVIYRERRFYQNLTKGIEHKTLVSVLEKIKKDILQHEEKIAKLEKRIVEEENRGVGYLQRIGFLRFNPFSDTGGQQSFVLAILDRLGSGVVISSLFGRTGTRWFAKQVRENKGTEVDLSEEEKKVIEQAK